MDLTENKIALQKDSNTVQYTLYRKRWLILSLYNIYCTVTVLQWIQYSVIAGITVKYYSVSFHAVDWTAMLFSLMYIIFCIPGSYILDKLGLRFSILLGIAGSCIGAWIKVIAVHPDRFWLVLLSQSITAIFQVVVLPVPPKVAAVWFGAKEVSLACTIASIALQFGFSLGFLLPTLIVIPGDMEIMQLGLYKLCYGYAITTTIVAIILVFFFDDAPPTPPSIAQFQMQENKKKSFDYKKSLINLSKNKSFVMLLLLYGVHMGASVVIPVLLNQLVLSYYPDALTHVGVLGLLMTALGVGGSLIYGIIVNKFGGLKYFTWLIYIIATISTALFLLLINQGLPVVYFFGIVMGVSWCCMYCAGYELGAELTYPEPEAAFGGLLTISYQISGIVMTYSCSYFYYEVSDWIRNVVLIGLLLLVDILLFFIKFDFKRTAAEKSKTTVSKVI